MLLQVASLEDLWKSSPDARLEDLEAAQEEPENLTTPVALRYEDAAQYQVSRSQSPAAAVITCRHVVSLQRCHWLFQWKCVLAC